VPMVSDLRIGNSYASIDRVLYNGELSMKTNTAHINGAGTMNNGACFLTDINPALQCVGSKTKSMKKTSTCGVGNTVI
jgi:hypothetical protein